MSRHFQSRSHTRTKQDELVKGGLTPTLQKRNSPPEFGHGEVTSRHAGGTPSYTAESSRDSSCRPLMTQPASSQLPRWDVTPGLLGIHNHGNTCFMNTILQCLSNTDLVSEYFVQRKYKELINAKGGIAKRLVGNLKADVAESLGSLLESLWSGEYTPDISNQFKGVVSKYNAQYKGSSQHDAQEFLSWLLQRLNDELYHNLHSTKKKAKEIQPKSKKDKFQTTEADSSPEMVLAAHQGFEVYNRFQALYRSSLTCPNCGEHSNTYEPYAFLSLPVPHKTLRPVYITVVYLDDNPKQLKIALEMGILSTIKDLRDKLAYELEVSPKRLVLCQVFDDGFRNTFGDEQHLSDIHESETVYVFETFPFSEINKPQSSFEYIQIMLVHIEKVTSTKSFRFCNPQLIRVHRDTGYIELQRLILKSMGLSVCDEIVEESKKRLGKILREEKKLLIISNFSYSLNIFLSYNSPQTIRVHRDTGYIELQRLILKSMGLSVCYEIVEESKNYNHALFKIRVIDSGVKDTYLPVDVEMPLYTEDIDRALSTYSESEAFGPPHVKFVIEWDPSTKNRVVEDDEDDYDEHQSVHKVRLNQQQPSQVSLDDCLRLFTQDEKLGKEELWNCPHCDKVQPCKKLGLVSLPDILVVHLKRFGQCGVRRNKLNILVNFPISNLEMGHHVLQAADKLEVKERSQGQFLSDQYDLYGVSNHFGNMNGGHYTAFCKNPIDNLWYEFDDTTVKPLKPHEIVSRAAYLLFYQRKKVTNDTRDKLLSGTHWVFNIYGPPPLISSKPDTDAVDGYIERIKIHQDYDSDRPRHYRAKSEPYNRKGENSNNYSDEDYLRREINSPRGDDRPPQINSPRLRSDDLHMDSLYVNMDQAPSVNRSKAGESSVKPSARVSVAEQIVNSKLRLSPDTTDGYRTYAVKDSDNRTSYSRTDGVDAGKKSHAYTTSSGYSNQGEISRSSVDEFGMRPMQTSYQNAVNSAKSVNKESDNLLNNERNVSVPQSGLTNGVKLKIHSNQINSESQRYRKDEERHDGANHNVKVSNTKIPNTVSSVNRNDDIPPPIPARRDLFSTPQQGRKSPSGPVQNGRGPWSTPQPQRKQYNSDVFRPPMDRQSSVPVTRARPQSSYDGKGLKVEGHGIFDDQPRSMPTDLHPVSSKPPLPKTSEPVSRPATVRSAGNHDVDNTRTMRPTSTYRVPDNHDRGYGAGDQTRGHESRSRRSDRGEGQQRTEYRERNKSADRQDIHRRSMHTKAERPQSYHQSTYNDHQDQYYLSQPIDDYGFSRSGRYATMHPGHTDSLMNQYSDEDMQYYSRQLADQQYSSELNQIHKPRSRVPVSYNPQRYQDVQRYQPHLHPAKMLTRLAMQEKERKWKSNYLKESSV